MASATKPQTRRMRKRKTIKIAAALDAWSKKSEMGSAIETLERLLKKRLRVPQEQLDTNPWLLNCANGTVDLRTGTLSQHIAAKIALRGSFLSTSTLSATAPEFITTLARITCEYGEAWLSHFAPFCNAGLDTAPLERYANRSSPCCTGMATNGKSTLLDLIMGILGGYAGVAAPGLLIGKNSPQHPNAIADLAGRRMVTTHESGDGRSIAGRLRETSHWRRCAQGALLCTVNSSSSSPRTSCNYSLTISLSLRGRTAASGGALCSFRLKRALTPLRASRSRSYRYLRDTGIAEKLAAEREGVLAWLVAGAVEWYKNGLNPPDIVLDASEEYQSEQDRVGQFIDEECETGAEYEEKLSTPMGGGLYPAYTQWCKASGVYPLSKTRFLDGLKRRVPGFKKKLTKETPEGGNAANLW